MIEQVAKIFDGLKMLFLQNTPSWMFNKDVNLPLCFVIIVGEVVIWH